MDPSKTFSFLFNDEYRAQNPEIDELNVFSSSTLARSADEQFWWKTRRADAQKHELNFFMQIGKAEHEFIQRRLPPTFTPEYKFVLVIPYVWRSGGLKDINVLAHIDAIDFTNKELIDLKTTWSKQDFSETYVRQVGFYKHWCNEKFGNHWKAEVHKVKFTLKSEYWKEEDLASVVEKVVTVIPVDNDAADRAYAEIYTRALECARKVDEWRLEQAKKAVVVAAP